MRLAAVRNIPVLLAALCTLSFCTPLTAEASAAEPACTSHDAPPAPIDTSEQPKPGAASPSAVPVPDEPVGGTRMGECGLIPPTGQPAPPEVTAASWVISDLDTGAVLAAKDPHARERPASLIKTLLAIVVIRELPQEQVITGTQEDADQEGTKVGIGPGGRYTVHQLLDALLMHSGNDAAHALAVALGGDQAALDKMNATARELGALDTRAATPSGLDGPGMSTSAYDLSVIFRAAMKLKEFAAGVGTRQIDFPGYANKPGFKVNNDNKLLGTYPGFIGGKTGFTDDARHTYLGAAQRDGHRLAVVLLRGERNPGPLSDQGSKLLDYGFALAGASSKPVGQLVDRSPEAQPKATAPADGIAADPPAAALASPGGADRSAFGNVGGPLVALAGIVIVLAGFMTLRRRRARIARQRA